MTTVPNFRRVLALLKVEGDTRINLIELYREAIIFPEFLVMDRIYKFHLNSELSIKRMR